MELLYYTSNIKRLRCGTLDSRALTTDSTERQTETERTEWGIPSKATSRASLSAFSSCGAARKQLEVDGVPAKEQQHQQQQVEK